VRGNTAAIAFKGGAYLLLPCNQMRPRLCSIEVGLRRHLHEGPEQVAEIGRRHPELRRLRSRGVEAMTHFSHAWAVGWVERWLTPARSGGSLKYGYWLRATLVIGLILFVASHLN
jgi:hypothetical protein